MSSLFFVGIQYFVVSIQYVCKNNLAALTVCNKRENWEPLNIEAIYNSNSSPGIPGSSVSRKEYWETKEQTNVH